MKLALQIAYRGMEASEAISAKIEERTRKLDHFFDRIIGCRVIVEAPNQRHRKGKLYHLRIDLTVPNAELVVGRDPVKHKAHADVYVAIRDAFNALERQLRTYVDKRRHHVKRNGNGVQQGVVVRLDSHFGFGFLQTMEGREVYFHKNSVLNEAFPRLAVGQPVRFSEEMGNEGPQASSVTVLRKETRLVRSQ